MNGASFNRPAGLAALAIAAGSLLYALFYLVLTPAAQRGADTTAFFSSFSQNPGPYLASWWILAISGLLTSMVAVAVYGRVRQAGESWALWSLLLVVPAGLLGAAHGVWEALRLPVVADLYAQASGDAAYAAAIRVAGLTPSQIDPRGFVTFGVVGIWMLATGMLALRGGNLPRLVGYLALAQGVLLIVLFAASALGIGTLVLVSGGLASLLVGPAFWVVTGLSLLRDPAEMPIASRATASGPAS